METKICTKCKRELPIDQFYWRDKKAERRRSECKDCHNGYVKLKYAEKQQAIEEIKSNLQCAKCGDKRGYVLDFHHCNPEEKDENISRLISSNASNEHINQEIEKCVVLCANCHREFHYLEKINNITIDDYLN